MVYGRKRPNPAAQPMDAEASKRAKASASERCVRCDGSCNPPRPPLDPLSIDIFFYKGER